MTCKVCNKKYTGQIVDRLRLGWSNCKESDRKFLRVEDIRQKSLPEQFLRDRNQSFDDVSIYLIDKTDFPNPLKGEY